MELKSLKPHTIFFDTARFKHPEFNKIMRGINELIKCGGTVPVINCLVGPSRVGKSVVISSVCKQYENHINTEHQPIVNIDIEPDTTPKMIYSSIIEAMGVPAKGNVRELRKQLCFLTQKKKVRLIIIDEMQHALPVHQNSPNGTQKVADIIKLISDGTNASMLLVGLENTSLLLQNKFKKNKRADVKQEKQLFGRSFSPMHIPRIRLNQKARFLDIMKGYLVIFNALEQKYKITMPDVKDEEVALKFWVACKGHFGRLRFLFVLALETVSSGSIVTEKILSDTYEKVISDKASYNPFNCTPQELRITAKAIEHSESLTEVDG